MNILGFRILLVCFAVVAFAPFVIAPGGDVVPQIVQNAWIQEVANSSEVVRSLIRPMYFASMIILPLSLVALFFERRVGVYIFCLGLLVVVSGSFVTRWSYSTVFDDFAAALFWLLAGVILFEAWSRSSSNKNIKRGAQNARAGRS